MRKSLSSNHRLSRRRRPQLECLEDRSVPATFFVNTTLDVVEPTDRQVSLREAITAANARPGADLIVVRTGVFGITVGGPFDNGNLTGDFDVTDSVTIRGAGRNLTFLDGRQIDRVFHVIGSLPGSIQLTLERMTVRNGVANGPGGGIAVEDANLVVRDATITDNRALGEGGGGIWGGVGAAQITLDRSTVARNTAEDGKNGGGVFTGGDVTVRFSLFHRNIASASGGGIFALTATLTNCTFSGNAAGFVGGGIHATAASLTNCTFSGNSAESGGGISAETATLTKCNVVDNSAAIEGGGLLATSTATLTNCIVSGNRAREVGGGIGAASATLTNCTVSGNSSDSDGGGMFANTTTLVNCTFSGNSAEGLGGGIWAGTLKLTSCTINGNFAINGGGIYADTVTLSNGTVSGNSARSLGGGIFAAAGDLINCTIVENLANNAGGISHDLFSTRSLSLKNTIVARNLVRPNKNGAPDVSGSEFTSLGHNLIGDSTSSLGFIHGNNGDIVGMSLNPIDPRIGPLANNGGPTKTHALLRDSPAIDAGSNEPLTTLTAAINSTATVLKVNSAILFVPGMKLRLGSEVVVVVAVDALNKTLTIRRGAVRTAHAVGTGLLLATDQRGFARMKDSNGDRKSFVDIGAFER